VDIKAMMKLRKRDLLKELFEFVDKNITQYNVSFYWGLTDIVSTWKRLGFSSTFSSQQGVLTTKPVAAYHHLSQLNSKNKIKEKIQILGLSFLSFIKPFSRWGYNNDFGCKTVALSEINEETLISFLPKNVYCLYLNKAFLKWRIEENHSQLGYQILEFKDSTNRIVAYILYSIKNTNVFFIEQLLFEHSLTKKQKRAIAKKAITYMKQQKAIIIRAMGFTHNEANLGEKQLLESIGFIFVPKGIPFIFKSNDDSIKAEEIYLSHLNTQGVF
jgi:hypothetical protein